MITIDHLKWKKIFLNVIPSWICFLIFDFPPNIICIYIIVYYYCFIVSSVFQFRICRRLCVITRARFASHISNHPFCSNVLFPIIDFISIPFPPESFKWHFLCLWRKPAVFLPGAFRTMGLWSNLLRANPTLAQASGAWHGPAPFTWFWFWFWFWHPSHDFDFGTLRGFSKKIKWKSK